MFPEEYKATYAAQASDVFDTIVIGSGFGGAMVAHTLVHAGERVLMLERGPWVIRGPENWLLETLAEFSPYYSMEKPAAVVDAVLRALLDLGAPSPAD